ncbi:zinc-binding dehydrogenase [Nocardioides sp. NPDC047086]|uniref:zinc-dependent alcohol dehydrogenase n=1 Tax=Nocardioides sp. NPDC047086 TaxID=3154810 RepID=UPI00340C31C2
MTTRVAHGVATDLVRASVVVAPGVSELRTLPLPEIDEDAGLLRVEGAGVCGTDVGNYFRDTEPRILGHENVGRVVALGRRAAERWGIEEGARVAVEEYLPCGHCAVCRTTDYRLCAATDSRAGGTRFGSTPVTVEPALWGGYSQYLYLHPRTVLHRIPEDMDAHLAAMTLPVANGYEWAVIEGRAGPGRTIVVIGPGQQGLACVYAAKAAGADQVIVLGLGRDARRLELAREYGAAVVVDVDEQDPVAVVEKVTGGAGADLVLDTARGDATTIGWGVEMVARRGQILISTATDVVDGMAMKALQWKVASIRGVRGHSNSAVAWAITTLSRPDTPLAAMSTHVFGLDEVDQAIRATGGQMGDDVVHVTVDPWHGAPLATLSADPIGAS